MNVLLCRCFVDSPCAATPLIVNAGHDDGDDDGHDDVSYIKSTSAIVPHVSTPATPNISNAENLIKLPKFHLTRYDIEHNHDEEEEDA